MSLPDSSYLNRQRRQPYLWDGGEVLSEMRDRSGAPNPLVRGLALLLALLLAAPLTVLVVRAAAKVLGVAL